MWDTKKRIGAEIRNARLMKKNSQGEVAEKLGVSLSKLCRVENGESDLKIQDLIKIAVLLPVDIARVFQLIENEVYRLREEKREAATEASNDQ